MLSIIGFISSKKIKGHTKQYLMDKRTLTLDKDINVMQMGVWIMQSSEWVAFLYETLDKGEKSIQQHNIWVQ